MHRVSNHPDKGAVVATASSCVTNHQIESLEQQRATLRRALVAAEQSVRFFPQGLTAHRKAKARVCALQNELRVINGRFGGREKQDFGEIIISIVKERLSVSEWKGILSEARRRHHERMTAESESNLGLAVAPAIHTDNSQSASDAM
jgi:hypothetical protein